MNDETTEPDTQVEPTPVEQGRGAWRRRGSLRLRLLLASVVSALLVVAAAGVTLVVLFDHHVERRIERELDGHLDQLVSFFRLTSNGKPAVEGELSDPDFRRPYSGLYWQVEENGAAILRSRSLWDFVLAPSLQTGAEPAIRSGIGPNKQHLVTQYRHVVLTDPADPTRTRTFALVVAEDRAETDELLREFTIEAVVFLSALVILLIVAAQFQVSIGLRPLARLRGMVLDIRRGQSSRLDGSFPDEVQPLVEELNGLIGVQQKAIERARARAGDMAHGLKTPLAVIASQIRALEQGHEDEAARVIEGEVMGMSRFVERELARARISAHPVGRGLDLLAAIDRLVRAMQRLPRGDEIEWRVQIPEELQIAVHREDADEIFGNLLDNARKWARKRVTVAARIAGGRVVTTVSDDGPGVPASRREAVLLRGHRLDESVQGSGLGLSIVDDLVASYGGNLSLGDTVGGGLKVELSLPATAAG